MVDTSTNLIIIGLPGSGKTTLMESPGLSLHRKFDDVNKSHASMLDFRTAVETHVPVAVSDILFCDQGFLDRFIAKLPRGFSFHKIYFKNDPGACIKNAARRDRKHVDRDIQMIYRLSPNYHPPKEALSVFQHED